MRRASAALGAGGAVVLAIAALAQQPGPPASRPAPVAKAPLAYFAAHCARCHGPHGSFYGAEFGAKRSDEDLRKIVHEMAEGPGGAPIAGPDLDAQVAYHRSLIDRKPFLVWTLARGTALAGEVSPGAVVTARAGARPLPVKATGTRWSVTLPKGVPARAVVLTARKGGATSVLALASAAFTHSQPLAPGSE